MCCTGKWTFNLITDVTKCKQTIACTATPIKHNSFWKYCQKKNKKNIITHNHYTMLASSFSFPHTLFTKYIAVYIVVYIDVLSDTHNGQHSQ